MRLGVDFDGTCVDHCYPAVGQESPECTRSLRELIRRGYRITLNTMRSGQALEDAVRWFHERDIPLYGINQDPAQQAWTSSPKVDADFYIDDKGLGCPLVHVPGFRGPVVDWCTVILLLDLKEQES